MPTRTAFFLERIGRRVAEVRGARGLTQERCAELLSVSTRYLQRVEAGEENLTVDSLVKIADALEVEPTDFFTQPAIAKRRPGRPKKAV